MFLADLSDFVPVSRSEILPVHQLYVAIWTPTENIPVIHVFRWFVKGQLEPVFAIIFVLEIFALGIFSGTWCVLLTERLVVKSGRLISFVIVLELKGSLCAIRLRSNEYGDDVRILHFAHGKT